MGMTDKDKLYQAFQKANEQRKRENFNYFFDCLEEGLVKDLDDAYASGDIESYEKLKSNIKLGPPAAKVFRNSEGKHKISFI